MTYSLSLSETRPELLAEALDDPRLKKYTLAWQDEDQQDLLLCIPGSSTRGVSLKQRDGETQVRLHTLASPADWKLGLNAVTVLAELTNTSIRLDVEGLRLDVDELAKRADAEWIGQRCHIGTTLCLEMVFQDQQTVCLQGWSEPYHIGPKLLQHLGITAETESEIAYMLLVKSMRAQQLLPRDESLHRPTGMVLSSPDGEIELSSGAIPLNLKVWIDTHLLDILALWPEAYQLKGRDPVWFPSKRLPELFAEQTERVDEQQYLIAPLTEADVLSRAEVLLQLYAASELSDDYQGLKAFLSARNAASTL